MAAEQRPERHGITVSAETVRGGLLATGGPHFQRRPRPHRAWRERNAPVGARLHLAGSPPDWFEGRGPRCVRMAVIEEASSRV